MKHLLIDAKNMLYRAVFAAESDSKFSKSGHHPASIVLHFLSSWNMKFRPDQVHVFWDAERTKTWRREISESYKGQRKDKLRLEEAQDKLSDISSVCIELFNHMGFRQYYQSRQEADDLIYAFCRMNLKDDVVIVSSDGDLKQISYRFENVQVHNPLNKKEKLEPVPTIDPVIYKALMGDKSDNIDGYYLVGDVKAKIMGQDPKALQKFLDSDKAIIKEDGEKLVVGPKRFKENLLIIDLGLCPDLLENMLYVNKIQASSVEFNLREVKKLAIKRKLRGVLNDINRYVSPFKRLGDKNGSID